MSTGRRPVVLVENDVGMRKSLERMLAAAGFVVVAFDSGESALQDRGTLDAHCMVLDIHLPGLSGFELYERLLAMGRKPAVIFMTGRDEAWHQARAKQLGALEYLVKPFSGPLLAAVVAKAFADVV